MNDVDDEKNLGSVKSDLYFKYFKFWFCEHAFSSILFWYIYEKKSTFPNILF